MHLKPVQIQKSKTVQSYYKSFNNGKTRLEKGRRIEDNSENPFIKVDLLNNGTMKTLQLPR